MKSLYTLSLITVISFLSVSGSAAVNMGQVTGSNQASPCNSGSVFADIPDLTLSLKTGGHPILIQFVVEVQLGAFSGAFLRPTIDGNPPDNSLPSTNGIQYLNGTAEGFVATMSFTRVYTPAKGSHTFGVQMSCQESAEALVRWLTVIELQE